MHTQTYWCPAYSRTHQGFPQHCSRGQWVFWGKGFCDQLSLRHPTPSLSCRVTVCGSDSFSEESGTEESISVSVSPSTPSLRPLGSLGNAARGLWTPALVHSTGGGSTWRRLNAPPAPPFSPDIKPTVPRGLSVGDAVGKKPFLPSETQGGCKRGLSVHPRSCGSGLSRLVLGCGPHT